MAAREAETKKDGKTKRKNRTAEQQQQHQHQQAEEVSAADMTKQQHTDATASGQADAPLLQRTGQRDPEQAFESHYLQQLTKEFANDLDKLRSAGDFREQSLGVLIDALKQGTSCFSKEERVRIGNAQLT